MSRIGFWITVCLAAIIGLLAAEARGQVVIDPTDLDAAVQEELQSRDVFSQIKSTAAKEDPKAEFRCLIISKGYPIATIVDGRACSGLTYFVYTYWYYDRDGKGPDEETSIHLLTAATVVPLVEKTGEVAVRVTAETAGDRRKRHGTNLPGVDVGKRFVRTVSPILERQLPRAMRPVLTRTITKDLRLPPGTTIHFAKPVRGKPRPTDFADLGVRRSINLGGATPETAALVVTFFTNDIMVWRAIKGRDGVASTSAYKRPWTNWSNDPTTGENDREDKARPGRHMVTLYLPANFELNRLNDKLIESKASGYGWADRAASVWIQPGPRWNGERLLLTDEQLDKYEQNHSVGFTLPPGFHDLLVVDAENSFKKHLHERAVGLRVVGRD